MKRQNDISEELSEMASPLADISCHMPYQLPGDYFENFTPQLLLTIKDLETPDVAPSFAKSMPYPVPGGYFNSLADTITAAALHSGDPVILSKENPFTVPQGYFENLPAHLLTAAKATGTAKIIAIPRRQMFLPKRIAAAAVILLTIGLGSYEFFFTRQPGPEKMLAAVPNKEIHDYLQHNDRVDVDRVIGNTEVNNLQLENKDIIEYLNETGWD